MTCDVNVPPFPTLTVPAAHDGVELVHTMRFETAATTETEAEPVRLASVAVNVAVSAVTSLTDAVPTPAVNVTVAG